MPVRASGRLYRPHLLRDRRRQEPLVDGTLVALGLETFAIGMAAAAIVYGAGAAIDMLV